jgi:hypothetical protein
MMYLCPIHGAQPGMEVSPDLSSFSTEKPREFVILYYYMDTGDCFRMVTVSKSFADAHHLVAGDYTVPVDYEFPECLQNGLACECEKCFEVEHNGTFVDLQWVPNE